MPTTQHAKPRNAHRHVKAAKRTKHLRTSRRSFARRLERQRSENAAHGQGVFERELRAKGISWRTLEMAVLSQVDGDWKQVAKVVLDFSEMKVAA